MRFYIFGAFGRAACMAILAALLFFCRYLSFYNLVFLVMILWTAYAFISGIVAVPYNDIVARSVPANLRSRLLATWFFGVQITFMLSGIAAILQFFIVKRLRLQLIGEPLCA